MAQHMKLKHPEIDYVMQNNSSQDQVRKDGRRDSEEEYEEDESGRDWYFLQFYLTVLNVCFIDDDRSAVILYSRKLQIINS